MDAELLRLVEARLEADTSLGEDAALLVLAACDGSDSLEAVLDGEQELAGRARKRAATKQSSTSTDEPEPLGAYLRSITVEGFRGVGSKRTLDLTPGPGLTLVLGRNGSGKSSFAEALEILLTGS